MQLAQSANIQLKIPYLVQIFKNNIQLEVNNHLIQTPTAICLDYYIWDLQDGNPPVFAFQTKNHCKPVKKSLAVN